MKKHSPPWFKPLLRRLFKTTTSPLSFFEDLVSNKEIVRLPSLKTNYIINSPEAIYKVLLTNRDNYTKLGTSYEKIENVIGTGLLTASAEEWAIRRQRYQPKFQNKYLKEMPLIIQKYTEAMLEDWEKKQGKLTISDEMLALTMNISSEMLLGIDASKHSLDLVKMIHILNVHASRSLVLWKWLPTIRNIKCQIAKNLVDNFILNNLKLPSLCAHPLLGDLFIKDEAGNFVLSKNEILGEVKNFFVAGHETTGNAISWTLYCLAKNHYALKRVTQEIQQTVGHLPIDYLKMEELTYLDKVIQESLRLYPPIWIITRKAINDDVLAGYHIPGGSLVTILPYLMHRHPKYWNQPTIFYPERFSEESSLARPKCAYIPFGFGPRVCIGHHFALLNMKMILAMVLQRYEIKLPRKNYSVEPLPLITLKPSKKLILHIKSRR
jgi:cytochrome P450